MTRVVSLEIAKLAEGGIETILYSIDSYHVRSEMFKGVFYMVCSNSKSYIYRLGFFYSMTPKSVLIA